MYFSIISIFEQSIKSRHKTTAAMKNHLFLFVLMLFLSNVLSAQSANWIKPYTPRIDSLFADLQQGIQPGLAVGIVKGGQLVLSKGYGLANLEHRLPFAPNTVSDIGSLAKQITCFAVVLLAQRNQLSLDDNIRKYLPDVPDFGQPITIRHLIHHVSGIREIYGMLELAGWRQGDAIRQNEALDLTIHSRELNFAPGNAHSYCNTGYMLLAEIIQKASGQLFEPWMKANIFAPLGMKDTYIMDVQGELFPNVADSYAKGEQQQWIKQYDNSTVIGAGGIYTTLTDLARWASNYRDGKLGGMAALQQMYQRGILNSGDTLDYAFGLEVDQYRGLRCIQHTGSSAGYRAALLYFPDQDLTILVKSNFANFNSLSTCRKIADIVLAKTLKAQPMRIAFTNKIKNPAPPIYTTALGDFVGRYYCPDMEMTYTIAAEQDGLIAQHRLNGTLKLKQIEVDLFEEPSILGKIQFERNATGAVTGMRVTSGSVLNLWMGKVAEK